MYHVLIEELAKRADLLIWYEGTHAILFNFDTDFPFSPLMSISTIC